MWRLTSDSRVRGGTIIDSNGEQKTDVKIGEGSILEIGKI